MFATNYWEESGVQPDILATAKSIAAGVPLSAIVAREEIMEASAPGTLGGTSVSYTHLDVYKRQR